MDLDKAGTHSDFKKEPDTKNAEPFIGVWLTDLNRGFSLGRDGDSVKRLCPFTENSNQAIKLDLSTWRQIITHELSMYDAIITGKVSINGDHWEVIHFFDHCKQYLNLD